MTERPEAPASFPGLADFEVTGAQEDATQVAGRTPLSERIQQRFAAARSSSGDNTAVRPAVPAVDPPAGQSVAGPESVEPETKPKLRLRKPPRRARLRLTRIDPWSVMKTSFLLAIAFGIVTVVAVLMVWSVLGAAGVWDSINSAVRDIVGEQATNPFTIQDYLGTDRVLGFTMLVAVIDVVLITAIATLAAFLYNMSAALLGGIEVTLAEDE